MPGAVGSGVWREGGGGRGLAQGRGVLPSLRGLQLTKPLASLQRTGCGVREFPAIGCRRLESKKGPRQSWAQRGCEVLRQRRAQGPAGAPRHPEVKRGPGEGVLLPSPYPAPPWAPPPPAPPSPAPSLQHAACGGPSGTWGHGDTRAGTADTRQAR